jgi:hypothetical protein
LSTTVTVTASTAVVTASTTEATISVSGSDAATVTVAGAVGSNPIAQRWSPVFQATGLTFTGSGATYPTYNSWFVKHGQLVTFQIEVICSTVTNFGTGQYKLELPVAPLLSGGHFPGWVWRDPAVPADDANHIILNVDYTGTSQTLDLHFLVGASAQPKAVIENQLKQGAPGYNLTTVSRMYVNGTYIGES